MNTSEQDGRAGRAARVVATSTICLAAAFSASLFAVVDGTILRPPPFPESNRIISLHIPQSRLLVTRSLFETLPGVVGALPLEEPTYVQRRTAFDLGESSAANHDRAVFVSPSFFRLFGAVPGVGRPLLERDAGVRPRPAVLAHSYWVREFDGAPDILGRVVSMPGEVGLGAEQIEVVGVMPPGFEFPYGTRIWLPHVASEFLPAPVPNFARLRPGVDIDLIRSALPDVDIRPLRDYATPGAARAVVLLVIGSVLLFLVTWTQLAASLVGETRERAPELRTRFALGARRTHLAWLSMRRVFSVAALSVLVSSALAAPVTDAILSLLPADVSAGQAITVGPRALQFVVALHLLGTLMAAPAAIGVVRLSTTPSDSHRFSRTLATLGTCALGAQIGLTAMLVVIAAATVKTYIQIDRLSWGVDPKNLYAIALPLPDLALTDGASDLRALGARWQESLIASRAVPGVESAALAASWPISPPTQRRFVPLGDADGRAVEVDVYRIGHGWIGTVKGRVIEGGEPAIEDARPQTRNGRVSRVALINRTLADRLRSDGPAVGMTLALSSADVVRITGVIDDVSDGDVSVRPGPAVYAYGGDNTLNVLLVRLKESGSLDAVHRALDDIWSERGPERSVVSIDGVVSMASSAHRSRFILMMLAAAFCLPSVLAGVVWVARDLMRRRSHEIAVRLALGATPHSLRRSLAAHILRTAGLAASAGGLAGAAILAVVAGFAPGVGQADVITSGMSVLAFVASSVAAVYLGTRSITAISPMSLLKASSYR